MSIKGVILAGGENRRFGGHPKGSIPWDGQTLFDRVFASLNSVVEEVHVSVHEQRPPGISESIPKIGDEFSDIRCPMNGIYSSLVHLEAPLLVLPWDMPGINALFLEEFIREWKNDRPQAYYVCQGDQPQPFPGIYTPDCVDSLGENLREERFGMIRWLRLIDAGTFQLADRKQTPDEECLFLNINEPGDIRSLNKLL